MDLVLKILKKTYWLLNQKKFSLPACELSRSAANEIIYNMMCNHDPIMIARLGSTELITINNYLCITEKKPFIKKIWDYISDKTHLPWWQRNNFKFMKIYSGVFPPTEDTMVKFSQLYLKDIPHIDLLGSWQYYEKFLPLSKSVVNVHLETLYPFFVDNPWTSSLKGKKVLVVHPFEDTIKQQYLRKDKLFSNPNILPDFELITLRAIQSAADENSSFNSWFDALDHMKNQIKNIDFDICLLGCGAYGLPLAAYVKQLGKKSLHFGGGLQLLFGIKGKRWDDPDYLKAYGIPEYFSESYASLYNEYWIRPLATDTPKTAKKLDGATYW